MKIEKLISVIRSLAQLDRNDSHMAVTELAGLVWATAGMDTAANARYAHDFRNACGNYLRTYQAQLASDAAQGYVICLYTDGIVKTTQFPSPTDWDKCLCAAAADIYTAYGECVNENGTGSRQLTGRAAKVATKDSASDTQILDTLMGKGFTNGTGAWASKRKTPRSSAKGGIK
jgi:hypothetical protein